MFQGSAAKYSTWFMVRVIGSIEGSYGNDRVVTSDGFCHGGMDRLFVSYCTFQLEPILAPWTHYPTLVCLDGVWPGWSCVQWGTPARKRDSDWRRLCRR